MVISLCSAHGCSWILFAFDFLSSILLVTLAPTQFCAAAPLRFWFLRINVPLWLSISVPRTRFTTWSFPGPRKIFCCQAKFFVFLVGYCCCASVAGDSPSQLCSWATGSKFRVFLVLTVSLWWFLENAHKIFDEMLEREKILSWGFVFWLFDLLAYWCASALI
jgi:hypothetical protein